MSCVLIFRGQVSSVLSKFCDNFLPTALFQYWGGDVGREAKEVGSVCSCLVMNTNLCNTIFTRRTGHTKGSILIVSGHPRVTKGMCARGIRKVGIRGCNTRVFRAGGGGI